MATTPDRTDDLPDGPPAGAAREHLADLRRYYRTPESRLIYAFLGGTKHYGYFEPGDPTWDVRGAMRRMEDLLAQTLQLTAGKSVLDAGCGVGDVAARLAGVHGLRVTGIDIQGPDIVEARQRATRRHLADRLDFAEMDYTALTFPDASFDAAYTIETLVHSDRVEAVLAGLYRVLRPGGTLVHFEYSRSPVATTSPHDEQFMTEINQVAAMPAFQRLEHGVLEQLLGDTGFVDIHSRDITANMLPMLRLFATAGWLPYLLAAAVGQTGAVVNSMAGVEFYQHRDCWRYNIYSCRKPD